MLWVAECLFLYLVDVSDVFFFSARGRGRGSPGQQAGGESVFFFKLKVPGGGGVSQEGWERGGRELVCWEFGGGGQIFFFSGPKCLPFPLCDGTVMVLSGHMLDETEVSHQARPSLLLLSRVCHKTWTSSSSMRISRRRDPSSRWS